jgi:hypothetical protein
MVLTNYFELPKTMINRLNILSTKAKFNPALLSSTQNQGPASLPRTQTVLALFNGSGKPLRPMSNLLNSKTYQLDQNQAIGIVALFKMNGSALARYSDMECHRN